MRKTTILVKILAQTPYWISKHFERSPKTDVIFGTIFQRLSLNEICCIVKVIDDLVKVEILDSESFDSTVFYRNCRTNPFKIGYLAAKTRF
jgi:hypothetical protein